MTLDNELLKNPEYVFTLRDRDKFASLLALAEMRLRIMREATRAALLQEEPRE